MREGIFTAPFIKTGQKIFDLFDHLVEVGHLVVHANETTFSAGAVVTRNVNDDGIVQLANFLHCINKPADIHVCVLHESGKDLGLTREELTVVFREIFPSAEILWAIG